MEFLEVEFAEPVVVTGIDIYETYNPGAVFKISLRPPSSATTVPIASNGNNNSADADGWVPVFNGFPHQKTLPAVSRIFSPTLNTSSASSGAVFYTNAVRIDMDTHNSASWSEIDAIKLYGIKPEPGIPQQVITDYMKLFEKVQQQDVQQENGSIVEFQWQLLSNNSNGVMHESDETGSLLTFKVHKDLIKYRCPKLFEQIVGSASSGNAVINGITSSKFVARSFMEYLYCEQINSKLLFPGSSSTTTTLKAEQDFQTQQQLQHQQKKEEQLVATRNLFYISELRAVAHKFESKRLALLCKASSDDDDDNKKQKSNKTSTGTTCYLSHFATLPNFHAICGPVSCLLKSEFSGDMLRMLMDIQTAQKEQEDKNQQQGTGNADIVCFSVTASNDNGGDNGDNSSNSKLIYAHKYILTERCSYFNTLLQEKWLSNNSNSTNNNNTIVPLENIDADTLMILLDFLYTGGSATNNNDNSVVNDGNAVSLFIAANQFLLDDQFTAPIQHMISNIQFENVFDLIQIADSYNSNELLQHCVKYLQELLFNSNSNNSQKNEGTTITILQVLQAVWNNDKQFTSKYSKEIETWNNNNINSNNSNSSFKQQQQQQFNTSNVTIDDEIISHWQSIIKNEQIKGKIRALNPFLVALLTIDENNSVVHAFVPELFASKLVDHSSRFASGARILNKPDLFPFNNDGQAFKDSDYTESLNEYFVVEFPMAIFLQSVSIYELIKPGCVTRIMARLVSGNDNKQAEWVEVWRGPYMGSALKTNGEPRIFSPEINKNTIGLQMNQLRVEFEHHQNYAEFDGVKVAGFKV